MRSTKLPSWSRRVLGFEPVPVPPHVFAVEAERLAYARFARVPGGVELREHRAAALPAATFAEGLLGGPLRDPDTFAAQLAGLLAPLSAKVDEASLVVPDSWLRVAFAQVGDLPRSREAGEEVLRWKLKRLVPFRVEELRLGATEVAPLPGAVTAGEEPRRLLLGFAVELLMRQLEGAFADQGVRIGWISNASLSLLPAISRLDGEGLGIVVLATRKGYSLLAIHAREPILQRFKSWDARLPPGARADLLRRELRLTRSFLAESLPEAALERVYLVAPREEERPWGDWLREGLEAAATPLSAEHLGLARPLAGDLSGDRWPELAPMAGAALREVA